MASFITTMFVPLQPSPPAQALLPHCTLKQSASCVTINSYAARETPEPAHCSSSSSSPAARKLREDLNVDNSSPVSNARSRNQFKPTRSNKGTTSYQLRQFAEATLGSGSLRKAVRLPEGEDLNEWLAVNGTHSAGSEEVRAPADSMAQLSISTTRSTFSMAQSRSSARLNHVRK